MGTTSRWEEQFTTKEFLGGEETTLKSDPDNSTTMTGLMMTPFVNLTLNQSMPISGRLSSSIKILKTFQMNKIEPNFDSNPIIFKDNVWISYWEDMIRNTFHELTSWEH